MSDYALIGVLTGKRETAGLLLSDCNDDLSALRTMDVDEIAKIDGIGKSTACKILAAIELGARLASHTPYGRQRINEAGDLYKMLQADFAGEKQEIVTAVYVNAKHEVIGREMISKGSMTGAHVDPRDVYRTAIKRGAAGIFLVHNHPSGDPDPSDVDISATRQLDEAGKVIGIKLIDHIIIGDGRYQSLRDMDILN